MAELPGWHSDPSGSPTLRWWDGSAWAVTPGGDPRIDLSRPDRDGVLWTWTPPPRWPTAPDHWHPVAMWEPSRDLDRAPRRWTWWNFDLVSAESDSASAYGLAPRPGGAPHSPGWTMDHEMSQGLVHMLEEEGRDSEAWGEIEMSSVPLVWTPPPGWPKPDHGWVPASDWKPPRSWGRAPAGWDFWQPDPVVLGGRQASADRALDTRTRHLLGTIAGTAVTLDQCERVVAAVASASSLALSPLKTGAELGIYPRDSWPEHGALLRAKEGAVRASSNLRTYILHLRYGIRDIDAAAGPLRAHMMQNWRHFSSCLNVLTEAHTRHLLAEVESRLEVIAGRRNPSRTAAAHLQQMLETLEPEIFNRIDLLSTSSTDQNLPQFAIDRPRLPSWRRAEIAAVEAMISLGFHDSRLTPPGADHGLDIVSSTGVAQVKDVARPVGRPDVQRLVGANMQRRSMLFFSTSGFTSQALDYGSEAGIRLFTLDPSSGLATAQN